VIQAILTEILIFVASVYHYSAYYYGQIPRGRGNLKKLDPIGLGTPTCVQFAFEKESIELINNLGIPKENEFITKEIYLIDETDVNYIISFFYNFESGKSERTLKIDKDMVKAILFRPEPISSFRIETGKPAIKEGGEKKFK
jgi:hypothetical protein